MLNISQVLKLWVQNVSHVLKYPKGGISCQRTHLVPLIKNLHYSQCYGLTCVEIYSLNQDNKYKILQCNFNLNDNLLYENRPYNCMLHYYDFWNKESKIVQNQMDIFLCFGLQITK